jgi:trk system potassium uptake protein TrkH
VPKAKETAKILYIIYIVLTLVELIMLLLGGLSLFESSVLSFGTAGTGGFSIKSSGIAEYSSYVQWVITAFMLIFGINFNLYFLILIKRFKAAICSSELWVYLTIVFASTALITVNISDSFNSITEAIKHSAFQVSSIMTTTGYATNDFNAWPSFAKAVLVLLMFIGGCAGSTAGGLKVSRVVVLCKNVKSNLRHMLHPRSVDSIRFEGKKLDKEIVTNVSSYFAIYFICFTLIFLILSFEQFDLETNVSAVAACFNNIGPGLSKVGPMGGYSIYSPFSKVVLSFAMLLGRLEILPMVLLFSPAVWFKRR